MFGFGEGVDEYNLPETLFKLPAFQKHTSGVVTMLEAALVMMIGNDMDSLATALGDLGYKHIVYGVQPAHYLIVESALMRALGLGLKDQWTTSIKKDWAAVFKFIARAMMLGAENRVSIVKATRRDAEQKKVATLRLKAIAPSKGTKVLTRSSRSGTTRFEGDETNRQNHNRSNSEPPKRPQRGGPTRAEAFLGEYHDEGKGKMDEQDQLSSETSSTRSMISGGNEYWFWGDSSVEPPRMPQRAVSGEANYCDSPKMSNSRSFQSPSARKREPVMIRNQSFNDMPLTPSKRCPDDPRMMTNPSFLSPQLLQSPSFLSPKMPQRAPAFIGNEYFNDAMSSLESVDRVPRTPRRRRSPTRLRAT